MKKKTIQYSTEVNALVALTKRLAIFESGYGMDSEDFFDQFTKGFLKDSEKFVE
jgi:hypothetical protein